MSIQGGQVKKPQRKRSYESPKRPSVNFRLPREFEALCEREGLAPSELMRQFVADLCDLRAWTTTSAFAGSGIEAHRAAQEWLTIARRARHKRAADAAAKEPQSA